MGVKKGWRSDGTGSIGRQQVAGSSLMYLDVVDGVDVAQAVLHYPPHCLEALPSTHNRHRVALPRMEEEKRGDWD